MNEAMGMLAYNAIQPEKFIFATFMDQQFLTLHFGQYLDIGCDSTNFIGDLTKLI